MQYIITGGEFNNKGAEAMTLITIDRIRRKDSNAIIYITGSVKACDIAACGLRKFTITSDIEDYLIKPSVTLWIKIAGKYIAKVMLNRERTTIKSVRNILSATDYSIDISGFSVSSKFKENKTVKFLDRIQLSEKFAVKTILMPQSFGPFDYEDKALPNRIQKVLAKCHLIYAREESGYQLLKAMGLNNVEKAYDMVLAQREIEYERVFTEKRKDPFVIETQRKSVGIIPNAKILGKTNAPEDLIFALYGKLIDGLFRDGYDVFLIPHAIEDVDLCKQIAEKCNMANVNVIDRVMRSYEYQENIRKFDFIIASRYHSIVHAFKVGVPAVILGWADKYQELAMALGQERFVFEANEKMDIIRILEATKEMENTVQEQRKSIISHLQTIQKNDYFSFLNEEKASKL